LADGGSTVVEQMTQIPKFQGSKVAAVLAGENTEK